MQKRIKLKKELKRAKLLKLSKNKLKIKLNYYLKINLKSIKMNYWYIIVSSFNTPSHFKVEQF